MSRKEERHVLTARAARLTKVLALVGVVAFVATGCSTEEVLRFGWPEGVTPQAEQMRQLWTWSVVAALAMGVLVWGLILWSIIFHRKKSEEFPRQTQYNVPLEMVYITVPTIIVVVLFYFTAVTQNFVNSKDEPADVNVTVTSFQWNWEFTYTDAKHKNSTGQQISTVGSSSEIPLLVLPTGKNVRYTLQSKDVIHSFWVPDFLFKRDTFPYPKKNNQDNVFQNRIDTPGAFVGRCAELCGTYHAVMNFEVRGLPSDVFDRYMALRATNNAKTAKPYTAAEALAELNCGELCSPQAITTKPFNTDRTAGTASGR